MCWRHYGRAADASVWRSHIVRVRRAFALVLAERIRLSREIHDTLLQNLIGVALRLDSLTDCVPDVAARRALHRTREQVEEHIRETRPSIWNLRSTKLEEVDLGTAIRRVAASSTLDTSIQCETLVKGEVRPIDAETEQQLLRIVEEALANAVRHAQCSHIAIELEYRSRPVELCIRDNGRGFAVTDSGSAARPGYGLLSMRERAAERGGALNVHSAAGNGTLVEAVIPTRTTFARLKQRVAVSQSTLAPSFSGPTANQVVSFSAQLGRHFIVPDARSAQPVGLQPREPSFALPIRPGRWRSFRDLPLLLLR